MQYVYSVYERTMLRVSAYIPEGRVVSLWDIYHLLSTVFFALKGHFLAMFLALIWDSWDVAFRM